MHVFVVAQDIGNAYALLPELMLFEQLLCQAAREAEVTVAMGVIEHNAEASGATLYFTLLYISAEGQILGHHRKLVPTHSERVYWGMGDASDIRVFDLDIGKVGATICYEHHMTLLRAALAIKGEEIHCALWPGWWTVEKHLGAKSARVEPGTCDIESAMRQHAIENQVFVVSSSWYLKPEDIPPELRDIMKFNLAIGGSCVINPAGLTVAGPVFERETIVHTEIDLSERELAKVYLDGVGHYSRPDLLTLKIRDEAWTPTGPQKIDQAGSEASKERQLGDLLERYNVTSEELETILENHLKAAG